MSEERRTRHVRLWVPLTWLALIGVFQLWAWRSGFGATEGVNKLVDAAGESVLGVVAFVAISLVRPVLLVPATLLTLAAGFLYGPVWGTVIVIVTSTASAVVAYMVGRGLIRTDVVTQLTGRVARKLRSLRARGFETILVLRLILAPFDVVNYAAGSVRVPLLPFVSATVIGGVPATLGFVLAGASIESFDGAVPSIDPRMLVASGALLAVSLLMTTVLRRREARAGG